MENNIPEAKEEFSIISRFKNFYYKNKTYILLLIFILILAIASLTFYLEFKKAKKIEISDNYIKAKIYLQNGKKDEAKEILKSIIFKNDMLYSTLSLFLVLNENLERDQIDNNKFNSEVKNLIILKKNVLESNFLNESEILEATKPLINSKSVWKYHALLLLGDYFLDKKQYLKAKEFYFEIISSENVSEDLTEIAISRMAFIND